MKFFYSRPCTGVHVCDLSGVNFMLTGTIDVLVLWQIIKNKKTAEIINNFSIILDELRFTMNTLYDMQ